MKKILTLCLNSLYDEYIYTDYDIGGYYGHRVVIEEQYKTAFLNELAKEFKKRAKDLLEAQYQCECCENDFEEYERQRILKCKKCGTEICDCCGRLEDDDWLCDNC